MKRHRRLRRLIPDAELYRRRAAGETVRELAPDYHVSHTTLSRFFARPEARNELKQAEQLHRAAQRAAHAHFRAEQKAEREALRRAEQQAEREALQRAEQQSASCPRASAPTTVLRAPPATASRPSS